MIKYYLKTYLLSMFLLLSLSVIAQEQAEVNNTDYQTRTAGVQYRFAVISDAHIAMDNPTSQTNFAELTKYIAAEDGVAFVIVVGDITHRGDYESMIFAQKTLDKMKLPYYVVPGNHDTRNNGCGDGNFRKVFGDTRFRLLVNGALFLGVNTGQIKEGKGHIAPEDVEWCKRQIKNSSKKTQLFIVAHHPFNNDETDNWFELTDEIRKRNAQCIISGHLHRNFIVDADDIPNIICRSVSANNPNVAYTLCDKTTDSLFFSTVNIQNGSKTIWHAINMAEKFYASGNPKLHPDYSVNKQYKKISEHSNKNLGSAIYSNIVGEKTFFVATHDGHLYAYAADKGNELWNVQTTMPIMGSVVYDDKYVVFGTNNGSLYCVDINTGGVFWKKDFSCVSVNNPALLNNTIYICTPKGLVAIDAKTGNEIWNNALPIDPILCTPIVKDRKIVVCTCSKIVAYNINNGALAWSCELNKYNLFSPVYAEGKIYFATSNGHVEVYNIADGSRAWTNNNVSVTHAIALNSDATIAYVMTTNDNVAALNTTTGSQIWSTNVGIGVDKGCCAASEQNGVVLFGTDDGMVIALNAFNGTLLWKHKIGNTSISSIKAVGNNRWVIGTTSGYLVTL